jgi:hypothetical protein
MNPDPPTALPDDLAFPRRRSGALGSATDWYRPPMDWSQPRDLDVGQAEPTDPLKVGGLKTLPGQQRHELGRRQGAAAATQHPKPWIRARMVTEDVGKHQHPGWAKHSGDLRHPNRRIRIGAGLEVEPAHGHGSVAHEAAVMVGGRWVAAGGL